MVKRLERLEQKVDGMDHRFDALDTRIGALDAKIDERFNAADAKIDERFNAADAKIDERFNAADAKIDERFGTLDTSLRQLILVTHEETKSLIYGLAEAMTAGFESIDRRFDAMERHWQGKWSDHDRAISNHSRRIGALERSRK